MTSIQWLVNELKKYDIHQPVSLAEWNILNTLAEKAIEMERREKIIDYNVGYNDGQCNHINDAEQYVNQSYRNI